MKPGLTKLQTTIFKIAMNNNHNHLADISNRDVLIHAYKLKPERQVRISCLS